MPKLYFVSKFSVCHFVLLFYHFKRSFFNFIPFLSLLSIPTGVPTSYWAVVAFWTFVSFHFYCDIYHSYYVLHQELALI